MGFELGDMNQYFGPNRKLFPWEREYEASSVSGALVRFNRADVRSLDGYITLRRGTMSWVFQTEEFVAALRELGLSG